MPPRDPEKVLVIKLGPLRQFVLAAAAMRQIRAAHPQAHVTLLTTLPFESLAKASPYFDAVESDGDAKGLGEWLGLIGRLRRARYDRVYDLQASRTSKAIHLGLGPVGPAWSGAGPLRGPGRAHPLDRQAAQLKAAGAWPDAAAGPGDAPPPDLSWILKTAPAERPVRDGINRRAYVLLIPGASETPPSLRWPPERYGELGRLLRQRGFDVVIVGAPQDGDVARAIQHQVPGARDLTGGPDFARVALLGARAAAVIGADAGLLHLASAAGAPAIVVCPKAADPALSAPRGHVTVLQAGEMAELPAATVAQAVDSLSPAGARSA
ncbi:glycosyltransferase family 9 protein [Phenylobacterium sp.]|jgi:ADP-heptose:LPS heptosyltransferase|uniref:glycosyltransferase family 9 protein n=1 Tax=Phenylobacterium sp. TaxID=1871053 RepID=UPI002F3FF5B3